MGGCRRNADGRRRTGLSVVLINGGDDGNRDHGAGNCGQRHGRHELVGTTIYAGSVL